MMAERDYRGPKFLWLRERTAVADIRPIAEMFSLHFTGNELAAVLSSRDTRVGGDGMSFLDQFGRGFAALKQADGSWLWQQFSGIPCDQPIDRETPFGRNWSLGDLERGVLTIHAELYAYVGVFA